MRWIGALAAVLLACTPARREVATDLVRDVHFEGNGGWFSGNSDFQVRPSMGQQGSRFGVLLWPLMYFVGPVPFRRGHLDIDSYRVEVWYAHRGWFDAQVTGFELRRVRNQGANRAGALDLVTHVEPGPRSLVRSVEIDGLTGSLSTFAKVHRRTGAVQPGEPFTLEAVEETRAGLLADLHNHAHAYATASMDIDAYPETRSVDVRLAVEPGLTTVYGPVTITGLERVPERIVRESQEFAAGGTYHVRELALTQQSLFDLGLFSLVTVQPDLSNPQRSDVPIEVRVTESRFRTVRVGAGATYDSFQLTPEVTTGFDDVNLFGSLLQLESDASVGMTFALQAADATPTLDDSETSTNLAHRELEWVFDTGLRLSYPYLLRRRLSLSGELAYERQLQSGQFLYQSVETNLDAVVTPNRRVAISMGPHLEWFDYIENEGPLDAFANVHPESFKSQYWLFTFDVDATYDSRDDLLNTRRGTFATLSLRQSLPIRGDERDFLFTRVSVDARTYRPLRVGNSGFPLVAAGRLFASVAQPWPGSAVPYPEREFLGGSNSLRGFRTDAVGPYDCLCRYQEGVGPVSSGQGYQPPKVDPYFLPRGGLIAAEIVPELRIDTPIGLTVALFGEVGLLAEDWNEWSVKDVLRYGWGIGARYGTPAGPIRLDLGFRPLFAEDYGPTPGDPTETCGPTYLYGGQADLVRGFDLFGVPAGPVEDRPVGFAFNIFLAIGEAF